MVKKNFIGKKPEMQIQADAVEAFLNPSPVPEKGSEQAPAPMHEAMPEADAAHAERKENTLSPTPFPRKAKANRENKRSKRLQLLITEDEFNYLTAVAWLNRRSVNDYMNMLIEQDMKKNPDAEYTFKGGK